jgi:NAD(P)-dependent dehydrogenase (short-subunit alcohol dehydrogenase family)
MKNVIILGVSADIGRNICELFHRDGFNILGTYRNDFPEYEHLSKLSRVQLVRCDLTNAQDIDSLIETVRGTNFKWNTLFSSVGSSEPIGRFFDLNFDDWDTSIHINMTSQLRVLHALYPYRDDSEISNVALLAGGGTNNPFRCYSAYCIAKIGLIKMCELIDDEYEDIKIFILGPGFVKTKTHYETIRAGLKAESNYERVSTFIKSAEVGTSFEKIYDCLVWAIRAGRQVVGGRNFSIIHDLWGTPSLEEELLADLNMYKLRRFKN